MQASRTPLGEYLRARRALISPEDVGLPIASRRRVAGLRRDEVAQLADVSAGYYLRLEQGHDSRPSAQVLQALSRALQLDASAFEYMSRLVQIQTNGRRPMKKESLTPQTQASIHALFSQWKHTPAYLMDGNQDVLMSNDLARAMAPGALEPESIFRFSSSPRVGGPPIRTGRTRLFAPPPRFDTVRTRRTRACTRSSASCTCATQTSVVFGRGTMLGPTTWDRSTRSSPPSARSVSPVRRSSCPAPRAMSSWCSTPSRARSPRRLSTPFANVSPTVTQPPNRSGCSP